MKQKKELSRKDCEALSLWAADCAGHVLPYFEKVRPRDHRPRKALKALRAWVRGAMKVGEVRRYALAAHAAARAVDDAAARAAARAAGQAAATAHVVTHAGAVPFYAMKAAAAVGAANEREWECARLPKRLRSIGFPVRARRR